MKKQTLEAGEQKYVAAHELFAAAEAALPGLQAILDADKQAVAATCAAPPAAPATNATS